MPAKDDLVPLLPIFPHPTANGRLGGVYLPSQLGFGHAGAIEIKRVFLHAVERWLIDVRV